MIRKPSAFYVDFKLDLDGCPFSFVLELLQTRTGVKQLIFNDWKTQWSLRGGFKFWLEEHSDE